MHEREKCYNINDVFDMLLPSYERIINYYVQQYYARGECKEDLYQQGLIGLYRAIKGFNSKRKKSFHWYACLCIKLSILNLVRASNSKKTSFYYNMCSLDDLLVGDNHWKSFKILELKNIRNPLDILLDDEYLDYVDCQLIQLLSDLEYKILKHKFAGMSIKEIAETVGCNKKSIDNAMYRIKKKILFSTQILW